MNLTPFFVICGLVCLFWLLVHRILAAHLDSYKILAALLLSVFFSCAGDVLLGSLVNSVTVSHLVCLLAAPAVIPLTCLYFALLSRPFQSKPLHFIWIVIPAALFTAGLVLTGLKGLEEADLFFVRVLSRNPLADPASLDGIDRLLYIWTILTFRIVMIIASVNMLVYCIVMMKRRHFKPANWIGFLFKGRKIRVLEIQMSLSLIFLVGLFVKVFVYLPFYDLHPGITVSVIVVMAILLFYFGLFALFGSREYIQLEDLTNALRFNYSRESQSKVAEEVVMDMVDDLSGASLTKVISRMTLQADAPAETFSARRDNVPSLSSALFKNAKSWDEGSLVSRFQRLMMDEQLYLQTGLGLDDVASRLKSNKTYISKMVNQTYGIGFPEVLNILRVDYAQQYIRKHKKASQEEIARASGFLSASSFNTVFKRITGYTPKVWSAQKQ